MLTCSTREGNRVGEVSQMNPLTTLLL